MDFVVAVHFRTTISKRDDRISTCDLTVLDRALLPTEVLRAKGLKSRIQRVEDPRHQSEPCARVVANTYLIVI